MKYITLYLILNWAQIGPGVNPELKTIYLQANEITAIKKLVRLEWVSTYDQHNKTGLVTVQDACLIEAKGQTLLIEWSCLSLIDEINRGCK